MAILCASSSSLSFFSRFEEAKKEAHAVDIKLAEKQEDDATLEKKWPFLGVPLTVKEAFQLQGMFLCIFFM